MKDVGFDDLDAIWLDVSLDDIRRITGIARRVLRVPTAMLCSAADGGKPFRFPLGDHRFLPHDMRGVAAQDDSVVADPAASSALPVLASLDASLTFSGRRIGTLSVFDSSPRSWSEDDRTTLSDLADCLANLVVLRHRAGRVMPDAFGVAVDSLDQAGRDHAIASPAQPDLETTGHEDDAFPESAHILLADDLDLNRKLICDMLSLEGHIVDSVPDGAAAVKAAGETRYDLILMDMIMPGMDGVAATRAIRALPAPACEVPIVALTAHSLPEQLESCLQAGMDATLVKPMTMDALTSAVAIWTRTRRKAA